MPLLGIEAIAGRSSSTHFARFEVRFLGENQLLHELSLALQVDAFVERFDANPSSDRFQLSLRSGLDFAFVFMLDK